ncbi:DEAD/DEAH box helicase [Brochothrix campestris]
MTDKKTKFDIFGFKPFINEAIAKKAFFKPTKIQEQLIPTIQRGESAIGQSQTGTGKTHTYLLPLMDKIDPSLNEVQVIITAPSRELASQIYEEARQMAKLSDPEIHTRLMIGGTDKKRAMGQLKTQPQIVVGTPGRIYDLMREKALEAYTATTLVVDEADLMLDMGFLEDVDNIASRLAEKLQILVFSATIPEKLKPFLKKYMENPRYAHIQPEAIISPTVTNILVDLKSKSREQLVYDITTTMTPFLALIFCNTKAEADVLTTFLLEKQVNVAKIHGGVPARDRKRIMKQIRNLDYQYVVATDLAARGIDIEGASHVINHNLPDDPDFFIHRAGRTGRAGQEGISISIYEPDDEEKLVALEKRGVEFSYQNLKKGEWIQMADRNRRKFRKEKRDDVDARIGGMVKKAKANIKPGYKKKINRAIEKNKERAKRAGTRAGKNSQGKHN